MSGWDELGREQDMAAARAVGYLEGMYDVAVYPTLSRTKATPSGKHPGIRSTVMSTESTTSSTVSRASPRNTWRWPYQRRANDYR